MLAFRQTCASSGLKPSTEGSVCPVFGYLQKSLITLITKDEHFIPVLSYFSVWCIWSPSSACQVEAVETLVY